MTETMTFAELQRKMQIEKSSKQGISYSFRNAEEIFTKFKKIGSDWSVVANDELFEMAGRIFVKATAKASKGDEVHESTAYAELDSVPVFKNGNKQMQVPQWTGAVSSYARKYALQGLFGIGEEDVDSLSGEDTQSQKQQSKQTNNTVQPITDSELASVMRGIEKLASVSGSDFKDVIASVKDMANISELKEMPQSMVNDCLKWLAGQIKAVEESDNSKAMNLENM